MNALSPIRRLPRSTEIKRVVKAARDAGLDVAGIDVSFDGIRIVEARAIPAKPSLFDELEKQGKI